MFRLRSTTMLKSLFRLALKLNSTGVLRTAEKLEYGAGIFCAKLAKRATDEGYCGLAQRMASQFTDEDSHARMLGGLVDGSDRLHPNCPTGIFNQGEKYLAFDGISQRYWAAKLFFWFRKPEDFDWADILAFMYVIEGVVQNFYEVLSESPDSAIAAIALKILVQEQSHSEYLKYCLGHFYGDPGGKIAQWEDRLPLAVIGAIVDLLKNLRQCGEAV